MYILYMTDEINCECGSGKPNTECCNKDALCSCGSDKKATDCCTPK